jgi:hypothetical protein
MLRISFRLDDQGLVVADGLDRASPLAMLLETDIGRKVQDVDHLINAVSCLRPFLSTEYIVPEPVDFLFEHTHLQFIDGLATVRFISPGDPERLDTLNLKTFEHLLRRLRRFRVTERMMIKCLSQPVVTLYINEEYGCIHWLATLTVEEYRDLIRRWETIRGLSCSIPVQLIVPQAKQVTFDQLDKMTVDATCHIHQCDDSYLDGSDHLLSEALDGAFWMDGQRYDTWGAGGYDLDSKYPDVLLSRAVTVVEVEAVLAEILPEVKVFLGSDERSLLNDVISAAVLTDESDPQWPARLRFPVIQADSRLGIHPHILIAKQLADRLKIETLIEPS